MQGEIGDIRIGNRESSILVQNRERKQKRFLCKRYRGVWVQEKIMDRFMKKLENQE